MGDDRGGRSDADLVAAVAWGDEQALWQAYERHGAAVWGLARRVTNDAQAAEDVCQAVFLRLWQSPDRFDPARGALRSWLLAQAHDTLARLSPETETPPPGVWDSIARQLPGAPGTSAPPVPPAPPGSEPGALPVTASSEPDVLPFDPDRPRHRRRPSTTDGHHRPFRPWLAAAAAVTVVLGIAAVTLRGSDDPDLAETAADAAEDDTSTVVQLATATGDAEARVVRTADGQGYVLLDNLPDLPRGRTYQLWKTNGTEIPISLGVVGDGSNPAAAVGIPADATAFAISDEPVGGAPAPTGPIVAVGESG